MPLSGGKNQDPNSEGEELTIVKKSFNNCVDQILPNFD